jgi:putative membrane-bound dehydrogenase-like protein
MNLLRTLILLLIPVLAPAAGLRIGVAARDVTPDYPIRLNGFASRGAESDGVAGRIWVKALVIADEREGAAVLITTDNLGVPASIRAEVAGRLGKAGVKAGRLTITATHTHSAPMLRGVANPIFGHDLSAAEWERITRYTAEFTDALEAVALAAIADVKPATLGTITGRVGFAMNRRTKGGPVDHDLPLLIVRAPDGAVRAVWFSYACHCVTLSSSKIHGDWAGSAMEEIQRDHPGAIALASIGCGADQNPNSNVTGDKFDIAQKQGREIADEVKRLLGGTATPISAGPSMKEASVPLDFEQRTRAEWLALLKKGGQLAYYARLNLMRLDHGEGIQKSLDYPVQTWAFGDSLALVFLPGEVVVDYSLRLKRELRNVITIAYANDAPCYIPSERILTEGGYEGGGAMIYYDRPNRFAPGLEKKIIEAVHGQLPKFRTPPGTEGTQPKPPGEAQRTFKTKPGLVVELVASEPLVQSPVAIDWGADGRLWVCEMFDYPTGLDGNWKPGGRIKVLSDSDGDGRHDKGVVFLDGLPFPTGVTAYRKGALICAAPDILYAEDTNGDGRADKVEKLFSGFATDNYQARVNSLTPGLDGWFYGANGLLGGTITGGKNGPVALGNRDFRFRVETREFEAAGGYTQQGRVRDDFGRWFGSENGTPLWQFPLADHYLARNPKAVAPASRVNLTPGGGRCFPIAQQLPRYNDGHTAGRYTAACGVCIYRDDALGDGFRGNAFVCEPAHNLVSRFVLSGEGPVLSAKRADDERESEFLASTDVWFRPVQARTGPDGALYVVDMYRFLIEHPRWVPADRLAQTDTRAGAEMGRIWRVVRSGAAKPGVPRDLTKRIPAELAAALDSPNGTERDRSQLAIEAAEPPSRESMAVLSKLAAGAEMPEVRIHALSTLDILEQLDAKSVELASKDKHPRVREQAARLSEGRAMSEAVLPLADDADHGVRFQAALTLGGMDDPKAAAALSRIAARDGGNPWFRAALSSGRHAVALPEPGGVPAKKVDEAEMKKLVVQLLAGATGNRADALKKFAPALALDAAAWRGGMVFSRACATCHKLDSAGHDVGPNLTAMRDKPSDYWLKNILDPNAVIEATGAGAIFEMKDGRTLAGIVKAETANGFTLAAPGGATEVLARTEVKSRKPAPVSLMPDGLEAAMTPQDMADLIAFLRHAPKQLPGNTPAVAAAEKDGVIFLRASAAELRGGDITFEGDFGNVGYWHGSEDHAAWTTNVSKPGDYDVWMDFACDEGSAGNSFALHTAGAELSGKVPATGAWANYRREKVGTISIPGGEQRIVMRATAALRGALMDLRTVALTPAGIAPRWP